MRQSWTPDHEQYLLQHYQGRRLCEIAADLGLSKGYVGVRFRRLAEEGRADRHLRLYQPPWSAEELLWARQHLGRPGWTLELVAEKLGRTVTGLRQALKRRKFRKPVTGPLSGTLRLRDVMEILGWTRESGHHKKVRGWLESGLLKHTRVPMRGEKAGYAVYPVDLLAFLAAHPELYDRSRMPLTWQGKPNHFRELAPKPPPITQGYVMAKHAARSLGVATNTLLRWRREGRAAACHLTGPDVHPSEWFLTPGEVERLRGRMVRQRSGLMGLGR